MQKLQCVIDKISGKPFRVEKPLADGLVKGAKTFQYTSKSKYKMLKKKQKHGTR